jgi:hypothetical protein
LDLRRAGRDLMADHGISAVSGPGSFPAPARSTQEFLGHSGFFLKKFSAKKISTEKFLGFSTFAPTFF